MKNWKTKKVAFVCSSPTRHVSTLARQGVLLLCGLSIIACSMDDKADEAVPRLKVTPAVIEIAKTGTLADGSQATFQVTANKGYGITSNQTWLRVDKPQGAGWAIVTIVADENQSNSIRVGNFTVESHGLQETVIVRQTLQDPAEEAKLRTFYSENFDWAKPFAKPNSDPVAAGAGNSNRTSVTDEKLKAAWAATGLTDWNAAKNCISAYAHYIHFNSNGYYDSGVVLPALSMTDTANASLTFATCSDGGGPDIVPLVVEITEGAGSLSADDPNVKRSEVMYPNNTWAWNPMEVKVYGLSATTRLAIHTSGGGKNKYCRWFLDDIKLKEFKK